MNRRDWVVFGCGGHGREVAALIQNFLLRDDEALLGWLDDDQSRWGSSVEGLPILGSAAWIKAVDRPLNVAVAIGSCAIREAVVDRIRSLDADVLFPPIVHPTATLGSRVRLGEGALVQAGCILTCDIDVGEFAVLNVGVSLSHDAHIGAFASLHPGVRLAGGARVGRSAELGMGTHVIPLRQVGDRARTGAMAAVVRDVPPGVLALGVPAKPRS